MSSGREDRSPIASRGAAAPAAADGQRRGKAKRDASRSPSYLSLRCRDGRSPSHRRARRSGRYFDDQVESDRRSRSRSPSPSPRRRRRARSDSYRSPSRSRSPRRRVTPRNCRSRSRTRSEECEDRLCCRPRSPGDDEPSLQDDQYVRIYRPDDLFKCAHCFELLSSTVYEVTH